ncbi:MAG TPA: helix-turn-helix domain-containing protein [Actinophytocola sp.]|jgi:DNA-binding HxlR family transcriptional regulator|uniref:winged helix-turn-helix transcriptional regulator n=1 Tax=Actinophytocola sp. TaxID=1872138 RepID=UPI002F93082F
MRSPCSIARSLEVLGEKWTFLVIREALAGVTRFADFRAALGIAPDILTARLGTLVGAGVLEKVPYQEPGSRQRHEYHLTDAGRELRVVLGALQQWGDAHCPYEAGPTVARRAADGRSLGVAFVDDRGRAVSPADVRFERTAAYPA